MRWVWGWHHVNQEKSRLVPAVQQMCKGKHPKKHVHFNLIPSILLPPIERTNSKLAPQILTGRNWWSAPCWQGRGAPKHTFGQVSHWFIFVIYLFKYRKNKCMLCWGLVLLWAQRHQCPRGTESNRKLTLFSLHIHLFLPPPAAWQETSSFRWWDLKRRLQFVWSGGPKALKSTIHLIVWTLGLTLYGSLILPHKELDLV